MSVHSQPAAPQQAAHPEFPRHVVTAVLVSHDGERWLPEVLRGLLAQERPVQDVIAADTGSADSSATLVTETLGAERVLHLARRSGFGTAVAEAVRTAPVLTPDDLPYLKRPNAWDPVTRTWDTSTYDLPELPFGEPVHWLWLLHDDAAPEPDALAELLRQADASPSAAIVGAKLRGWYDRKQLLEVGVSIANSGRRWTGLDRREQDQGQHDQVRPVLSVSTAGMLIRRDVFEQLGGFDRRLPLMRDDVDLCWRAQAAGHRVLVAPAAVLRHAEAASRERRSIDCAGRLGGNPHRVDKAAAAYALLVNARGRVLPWVLFRLVFGTLLRVLAYLVGKLPGRALDEAAGLLATLLRPGLVLGARRRRDRAVAPDSDPGELRPLFPPPLATVRTTIEQVAGNLGGRTEPAAAGGGRHGAVESGPSDDETDALDVEQFARVRRLARRPGPMLALGLLLAALLACRDLIGTGALTGGALLPAPGDAGDLWDRYLSTWQPVGTGGTESAPPYLALLALMATGLLGSTGLTMTLLLVACVPLAGASAYFTSRPLVMSRLLRAWASIAYAFLPALTGAVAGGHLGTAVLAVLLPPLARTAILAAGYAAPGGRGSWRAVWACALLLAVATAFTPVIWPLALVLALFAVFLPLPFDPALVRARALRLGAVLLTPFVLLGPWSWSVLLSPSDFLREVGLPFETGRATAFQLLNVNPGGPGTPSTWLLIGIVLAALGALLRRERRLAVTTAWAVALAGLVFAVWSDGDAWAGPATLVYGLALLAAAALGADGARYRVAAQSFGWRQPVAVAVAGAAAAGPLLAAAGWIIGGANGPLERTDPVQVPAFVAEESTTQDQARTLVLSGRGAAEDGAPGAVDYSLVRGSGARLGDADLAELLGPDDGLSEVVGDLVAGSGADQTTALAAYAVRYVLVQDGSPAGLHRVLDTTPGLQRLSQEQGALWRVNSDVSRAVILPAEEEGAGAEPLAVPAGAVDIHTDVPEGPAGRVLQLADTAGDGWQATLDGQSLTPVTIDGWAQGFELPAGGGRLDVVHETPGTHTLWVWAQGFALLVLTVLALPGRRRELDDDLPEEAEPAPAAPQGRRARRQAAAEPPPAPVPAQAGPPDAAGTDGAPPVPPAPQAPPAQEPWPGYQDPWPGTYQDQGAAYPDGPAVPPQPYQDWDGNSYDSTRPYDYPADYGDGSNQR
ncbi:glycosyltransferase [Streptomyces sp. MP131-18]|uniref:glycosyltransferase n=1 Tax=Streptomyces sp. MP131-18 TaxID=1857892 RepID=UPI00097C7FDA|nr:glycosyltransferase [Streptomyces sp. MP131-18]ONK13896.1 N-acetylglucosaminyl-diphospho-decaprenol L-rhamnosyltransferase [Streptomyces sp. MP131-18]